MASPTEFTWEQKVYIVRAFAALRTVADILDTMQFAFGVRCRPDDLLQFDPNYRTLPPDLFTVFNEAKRSFEADPVSLIPLLDPIKQQAVIANSAQSALVRNDIPGASKLLEQLAKLQGGFFAGKAAKGGDDDKDQGPTGFSFALDKAHAEPD